MYKVKGEHWYWLWQSKVRNESFRAYSENQNKAKIKYNWILTTVQQKRGEKKEEYDREKSGFIKILVLKHRSGKCKRNDEMITPKEWSMKSKPKEKLLGFKFLALCISLWKDLLPHAKVKVNGFIFGKVVPRDTRLLTAYLTPVQKVETSTAWRNHISTQSVW